MPTRNDIAKLAGVSYGTVSNVINHKGNVSTEKIHLVEEAARCLGYNINAQAQRLRQEYNRHTAFILPDIEQRTYRIFYTSLKTMLESYQYETSLYLTNNSPENECACVQRAITNRPEYIITFSCADGSGEVYSGIPAKVVFINQPEIQPEKNQASIFFDFDIVVADFVEKIGNWKKPVKRVAFFFDSLGIPAYRYFYQTLNKSLKENEIELYPFFYDTRQVYHGAIAILGHTPPFDLVITNNPFYLDKLKQAQELLGCALPDIISFDVSETIHFSHYLCYVFDYREMARLVFLAVRDMEDKALGEGSQTRDCYSGQSVAIKARGFIESLSTHCSSIVMNKRNREINMITVTSPTAEILSTLSPYLQRCTGIKLKVLALPYEELFQILLSGNIPNLDLIRIDMAWNSRFAKKLYQDLGPLAQRISPLVDSFLPAIKTVYTPDLENLYTLPLDPSVQMLFYRRDLFEDATIKRLYYEQTRKQLSIPENFADYNRVAAFFSSQINPASPIQYGTTMVYGTAAVAACELLPRIKSMGGEIFDQSGKINICGPVFKEALDDYLVLKKYSSTEINHWWGDALTSFSSNLSAMTIIFINHVSRIIRTRDIELAINAGAAPVPGNTPLLGGGSIGIARQSKNVDRCIEFFNWVYSDEIANIITLLGGLSPCNSPFENEEILDVYPWLRDIGKHFKRGWRIISNPLCPRFDSHQFELIFGNAVRNAALGLVSSTEALEIAQRECEAAFV